MRIILLVALGAFVVGSTPGVVARKPANDSSALEEKLLGAWKAEAGCAGRAFFGADGTYELTPDGPVADDSHGVWKVRWDALPPTLVLTCTRADQCDKVGQTIEWKLIRLNDARLAVEHANEHVDRYARLRK